MQVLCKISNTTSDVRCKVCGQGFLVYWSRTQRSERDQVRRQVAEALSQQHTASHAPQAHPRTGFTVSAWSGEPAAGAQPSSFTLTAAR
ncbi:hypothetical protein [Granulicella tundricola]|uniref:Uncharacterized protein n=1 Tax=Granulicella tundricola (strain ATCC BAA-1859 / DSM 23138 / MP5ACTX9) TaxID=1198114 RepID=E8WWN6_GRATM|nr:hypothetical protein [Granulicella tundricola]ADW70781.1 hypothetical protein AciX9_3781 [Granulicella tundricola MP5ACTX9]